MGWLTHARLCTVYSKEQWLLHQSLEDPSGELNECPYSLNSNQEQKVDWIKCSWWIGQNENPSLTRCLGRFECPHHRQQGCYRGIYRVTDLVDGQQALCLTFDLRNKAVLTLLNLLSCRKVWPWPIALLRDPEPVSPQLSLFWYLHFSVCMSKFAFVCVHTVHTAVQNLNASLLLDDARRTVSCLMVAELQLPEVFPFAATLYHDELKVLQRRAPQVSETH